MTLTTSITEQHILATAKRLFFENGMRATGVDLIVAEAAIAKSTLYYHFKTKDDLILAVVQSVHEEWTSMIQEALKRYTDPKERIKGYFDAAVRWLTSEDYPGCLPVYAGLEFRKASPKIAQYVRELALNSQKEFTGLATQAGARNPGRFGKNLSLVMAGLHLRAMISRESISLEETCETIEALISFYCD